LLAVGDRHLENLLIDELGHFFHVDFGFIFGKNPPGKNLWPPPIRICKEMINAMDGPNKPNYKRFVDKCVTAFKYLRNHSKYIFNLFHLMIHAGIGDLPANDAENILVKMYEKFLPHIRDQETVEKEFSSFIRESANAFFPKFMEKVHVWAQYWK
jgi:phosphatidylinositol 3-kinase